jgi:hypothetical protein
MQAIRQSDHPSKHSTLVHPQVINRPRSLQNAHHLTAKVDRALPSYAKKVD